MKLTKKHYKAIQLIGEQVPDYIIVQECGIAEQQLQKWRADPDFQTALTEHNTQQMDALVPMAVMRLRELLSDNACPGTVRIQAIKEVFNYAQLGERKDIDSDIHIKVEYV